MPNFLIFGCIVQLVIWTRLFFYFLKALEWMPVFNCCNTFFWFCSSFFWIFSWKRIPFLYKLIGANVRASSFRASELSKVHYKKVLENLTNCWRLCIIILAVGVVRVLPINSNLCHTTQHHTTTAPAVFIPYILKLWKT